MTLTGGITMTELPSSGASPPAHSWDDAAFRRFLLIKRGLQPVTVKRVLERLAHARTLGLRLDLFTSSIAALSHGELYLERRLTGGATVFAYNNDTKALNLVVAFKGFKDVHFDKRREPRAVPRALGPDQQHVLQSYRHSDVNVERFRRALLAAALHTGMRVSEIAALQIADLDENNSRIHIRRPAKGGLVRWIPVPRWMWSQKRPLGAYLAYVRRVGLVGPLWWVAGRAYGEPVPTTSNNLRQTMWRIGQDVGFTVNFNVTRHTYATEHRRRGVDILQLKFLLGHRSVRSTEIYAEISPEDLELLFRRRPPPDPYSKSQGTQP